MEVKRLITFKDGKQLLTEHLVMLIADDSGNTPIPNKDVTIINTHELRSIISVEDSFELKEKEWHTAEAIQRPNKPFEDSLNQIVYEAIKKAEKAAEERTRRQAVTTGVKL